MTVITHIIASALGSLPPHGVPEETTFSLGLPGLDTPVDFKSIVFLLTIFVIALCAWLVRTLIESDPDPFYLNMTFFAFAGQLIIAGDYIVNGNMPPLVGVLLLLGLAIAILQVYVMRAHMRITRDHYADQLCCYKKVDCAEFEIEHWASVMLRITGSDFAPGSYQWLTWFFATEPREKSRREAFSMLPDHRFDKQGQGGMSVGSLKVPPTRRRKWLWRFYVANCLLSWSLLCLLTLSSQA